jgi:hypothetical protein
MKKYLDKGYIIFTSISLDEVKDKDEIEWMAFDIQELHSKEELLLNIKAQLK